MATKTVATFNNGLIEFQVDYDAANRLTALRCINQDNHTVHGWVILESNGRQYDSSFLPGNTYIPIPTGASQRIQFDSIGVHGQLIGVSFRFEG
jgi:hypothetical protein